jgi:hypothetical protein
MLVVPETVPEYVTTPTAPKLIELPVTLPLMCSVSGGDDSAIDPLSAAPLCVHMSEKVPLNGPLYGVGVGMAVGVAVGFDATVEAGVGVPVLVDALHPASEIAAIATTGARNLMSIV